MLCVIEFESDSHRNVLKYELLLFYRRCLKYIRTCILCMIKFVPDSEQDFI